MSSRIGFAPETPPPNGVPYKSSVSPTETRVSGNDNVLTEIPANAPRPTILSFEFSRPTNSAIAPIDSLDIVVPANP